ncbi:MAG: amidinotransferase [Oligoflexia bacterium]|nr:amidinotransferase [Oligoflexia bacterium]
MPFTASTVLMVEPVSFHRNLETAQDNHFQLAAEESFSHVQLRARAEHHRLRAHLQAAGITVVSFDNLPDIDTPDAVFPNNWFSTFPSGELVLYPMRCVNRRRERRTEILNFLKARYPKVVDLSANEDAGKYLEGTGSLVLDRKARVAFGCLSGRTDAGLFQSWCEQFSYAPRLFHAQDRDGIPIYHTNVMMSVAQEFALVCLESIPSENERCLVSDALELNGKEIIDISLEQVSNFCGNCLELRTSSSRSITVMSARAFHAFTAPQLSQLQKFTTIVHSEIDTIEQLGGGGVRCMLAELF